jgi:hypothetical protein
MNRLSTHTASPNRPALLTSSACCAVGHLVGGYSTAPWGSVYQWALLAAVEQVTQADHRRRLLGHVPPGTN